MPTCVGSLIPLMRQSRASKRPLLTPRVSTHGLCSRKRATLACMSLGIAQCRGVAFTVPPVSLRKSVKAVGVRHKMTGVRNPFCEPEHTAPPSNGQLLWALERAYRLSASVMFPCSVSLEVYSAIPALTGVLKDCHARDFSLFRHVSFLFGLNTFQSGSRPFFSWLFLHLNQYHAQITSTNLGVQIRRPRSPLIGSRTRR